MEKLIEITDPKEMGKFVKSSNTKDEKTLKNDK